MRLGQSLFLAASMMLGPWVAHAEPMACGDLQAVTKALAGDPAREVPAARAIDVTDKPVLLFVSPSGSWTMTIIVQHGGRIMACILTGGTDWQAVASPATVPGNPL